MLANFAVSHMHNRLARAYMKAFPQSAFVAAHTWPDLMPQPSKSVFCLSFDCDTEEDTRALPQLLDLLSQYNIQASFALIGELVERAPETHHKLVQHGHEIVNHGYAQHTQQRPDGTYYSSRFYHNLSPEEIETDIQQNHDLLQNLLNTKICGFRTPHFSTFQKPENRAFLYQVLHKMGYLYSSSVTAIHLKTARQSPRNTVWEVPMTGCWGQLRSPFDSWGLIAAPDRRYTDNDFARLFQHMLQSALQTPLLLNIYVDPSHVVAFPGFHQMLEAVRAVRDAFDIFCYTDLIHQCQKKETH